MKSQDLLTWRGVIGRREFAFWAVLLFAVKYNLDRLIAGWGYQQTWYPWTYLPGAFGVSPPVMSDAQAGLYLTLALSSLPFIAVGLMLTRRRLRDCGWPSLLLVLFFIPFLNLLFFLFLCLLPTRLPVESAPREQSAWERILRTDSALTAASLSILASALLGFGLTLFSTEYLQEYGWGLFVGTPFMMGFFSALIYSLPKRRSYGECALAALCSVGLVAAAMFILAFEGIFCLLMAAPLALILSLIGALFGWLVQKDRWTNPRQQVRLYACGWVVMPLLLLQDSRLPAPLPLIPATTTCVISAPVETVWKHILGFGDLPPPKESIFRLGIAYPQRARLVGDGIGAVRYCEFSTGAFVEPITAWEENRRLAFNVVQQPHPMREWSPYSSVHPAHLDGFFRSRRGEFRLTALPEGNTLLEGTTWYEQKFWPQPYWRLWSDYLIHQIHGRVLDHIKHEAEAASK
jgi:uncharacterized membrane protein YhaH (DUF805 family)